MATRSLGSLVQRLLGSVGLEPRGRSADLRASVARADRRVADVKRHLQQYRAEKLRWKARYRTMRERQARWKARQNEREQAIAHRLEAGFRHELAELQKQFERESAAARLQEISDRVVQANRSIQHGREILSALEVKLDLVDGAINTLDRRFRTVVTQSAEPGD